jgi:hypothetical protein
MTGAVEHAVSRLGSWPRCLLDLPEFWPRSVPAVNGDGEVVKSAIGDGAVIPVEDRREKVSFGRGVPIKAPPLDPPCWLCSPDGLFAGSGDCPVCVGKGRLQDLRFRFCTPVGLMPSDQIREIGLETGGIGARRVSLESVLESVSEDVSFSSLDRRFASSDDSDPAVAIEASESAGQDDFVARPGSVFCPDCQTYWGPKTREEVEKCLGVQICQECCNPPKERGYVDRFADLPERNAAIRAAVLRGEADEKIARDFAVSARVVRVVGRSERACLREVRRYMVKRFLDGWCDVPAVERAFRGSVSAQTVRNIKRKPEPEWVRKAFQEMLVHWTPDDAAVEELAAAVGLDIYALPKPPKLWEAA